MTKGLRHPSSEDNESASLNNHPSGPYRLGNERDARARAGGMSFLTIVAVILLSF